MKWSNSFLQVHYCRFENLSICLCSSKNDTPEISHYCSQQLSSYSPVKFAFFLKSRLLQRILLFMYICKQTFRNLYGWITREFLALRRNFLKPNFWNRTSSTLFGLEIEVGGAIVLLALLIPSPMATPLFTLQSLVNCKNMFFIITGHERESFCMFSEKVIDSKRKLEIDDPELP